jgi:hypothetical protein
MANHPDSSRNSESIQRLRDAVADLERRSRTLDSGNLRHDVGNAVGAARNALSLLDEGGADGQKFFDIARRNVDRAEKLLGGASASAPPRGAELGRDERNDLRRASEGDHGDTVGF